MFQNPYVVHCIVAEDFGEDSFIVHGSTNSTVRVSDSQKKNIIASNNVYVLPKNKKCSKLNIDDKIIVICKKTEYSNVYGVISLFDLSNGMKFTRSNFLLAFFAYAPLVPLFFLIAFVFSLSSSSAQTNAGLFFIFVFLVISFFVIKEFIYHRQAVRLALKIKRNIQDSSVIETLMSKYSGDTHIMSNFQI